MPFPTGQLTIDQTLAIAVDCQRRGQAAEAAGLYRQILAVQPSHANALHLLGLLTASAGDDHGAVSLFDRAIAQMNAPEFLYNRANSLLRLKRTDDAIADLKLATTLKPAFPEGLYALGTVFRTAGRFTESAEAFRAAVAARPGWADASNALGAALRSLDRFQEAEAAYLAALAVQPNHLEALMNLGNVRRHTGDKAGAVEACRRAVAASPSSAKGHDALGLSLSDAGDFAAAVTAHRRAVELDPTSAQMCNNLASALMNAARSDTDGARRAQDQSQALRWFEQAVRLDPAPSSALANWGSALTEIGRPEAAIPILERAVQLVPESAHAWSALGLACQDMGLLLRAIDSFEKSLKIDPDCFTALTNSSIALLAAGDAGRGEDAARRAVALRPDDPGACSALSNALREQGRVPEAVDAARKAVAADPRAADLHSNLVMFVQYDPAFDAAGLRREAEAWAAKHAPDRGAQARPVPNHGRNRRLRIGYVSADFTKHAVGRFILPVIQRHDRTRFEIHCFSSTPRDDAWTSLFRRDADRWHDIRRLDDDQADALIRREQIDILVDLSVHSAGNRLPVLGRCPAPVQISYLGYCGTTGMRQISHVLADRHMAPPVPETDGAFTETPLLLPDTYWCYRPPDDSPPVAPSPVSITGTITFGCLNNFAKLNDGVFTRWAEILLATGRSTLLISAKLGPQRQAAIDCFVRRGVDGTRIRFMATAAMDKYLAAYAGIDIALDPFPFNGGTTSCDALWMGVPLVTFPGRTPVGRAGVSILHAAGLAELIAADDQDCVRLAVELAADHARLVELRRTMRHRLGNSPLTDEPRFVRNLEAIYSRLLQG
jgi:predicted O-linked N-acetylglucosamine transferase (SPINDLY family)